MQNICDFVVNFTVCLEMVWFFPRFFAILYPVNDLQQNDNQKG